MPALQFDGSVMLFEEQMQHFEIPSLALAGHSHQSQCLHLDLLFTSLKFTLVSFALFRLLSLQLP